MRNKISQAWGMRTWGFLGKLQHKGSGALPTACEGHATPVNIIDEIGQTHFDLFCLTRHRSNCGTVMWLILTYFDLFWLILTYLGTNSDWCYTEVPWDLPSNNGGAPDPVMWLILTYFCWFWLIMIDFNWFLIMLNYFNLFWPSLNYFGWFWTLLT